MTDRDTSNPLQARPNSTVDDIAAVIGFTATLRLCAWYGDVNGQLYVPQAASEDHSLAKLIGMSAFRRLVEEWGNEHLSVQTLESYEADCRNRAVRDLLAKGLSPREIARLVFVGERRIQQIRTHLEDAGMLPLVLGKTSPRKAA